MNRVIKFRCWQKTCEEDKDGNAIWVMIAADCLAFENYEPLVVLLTSDEDSEIFMQYTDIKDKKGKEIYEGDLVTYDTDRAVPIVYKNGTFTFERTEMPLGKFNNEKMEVIGNIYENPELLKEK